jgi:Chalcone isomerase-like
MKFVLFIVFLSAFISSCESPDQPHPTVIFIQHEHESISLEKMGETERKGLYHITLYLQNPVYEPADVLFYELESNKEISQFDLIWRKSQKSEKIKNQFTEDFKNILGPDEYQSLAKEISAFVDLLPDLKENEPLTLRWIPGGTIEIWKDNQKRGEIHSTHFAKALWNLWLGSKSVVNRIQLISNFDNLDVYTY